MGIGIRIEKIQMIPSLIQDQGLPVCTSERPGGAGGLAVGVVGVGRGGHRGSVWQTSVAGAAPVGPCGLLWALEMGRAVMSWELERDEEVTVPGSALPRPPGPLPLYNTPPNLPHYRPFHSPLLFFSSCSSVSYRVRGPCSSLPPSMSPPLIFPPSWFFISFSLFSSCFFHLLSFFSLRPPPLYLSLNFFSFESL